MSADTLGQFEIDQNFTFRVAQLSGDFNPLHLDPVRARRYLFGATVIHGVCGTLKALDMWLEKLQKPISMESIQAVYSRPIRHGDKVRVFLHESTRNELRLELNCSGNRSQNIKFKLAASVCDEPELNDNIINLEAQKPEPPDFQFDDLSGKTGSVPLLWDASILLDLFPSVKRYLPGYQVSLLLGTTNIVGMHCPGLNSVFGSFKLSFLQASSHFEQSLCYEVSSSDARFSRVLIAVNHARAKGEIETFFRPKPVVQADFLPIKTLLEPDQFKGQSALVVGGSRGLGEVAAKLIAAGGGQVILSYSKGKDEAQRIVSDICAGGGRCEAICYDVASGGDEQLRCLSSEDITHIYYFASPLIENGSALFWDKLLFDKYCGFYLGGLATLLEHFVKQSEYRKTGIRVFAPSTIFIEESPGGFSEYIAAKAAMEVLVKKFEQKYRSWHMFTPRLPRLLTDQTASVVRDDPLVAAEVVLASLVEMCD